MFINSLSIKNFKSLKDFNSDFSRINLLVGDNGAGKSSLIDSIKLVLTNQTNEKLSDYINWDSNEFKIKSKFEYLNEKFEYDINYSNRKSEKYLKFNGEKYFQSDCVSIIQSVISPTITLYSSISEQGESYSLLKETPQNRFSKLKSILQMETLEKVSSDLSSEISEMKGLIIEAKTELKSAKERNFELLDVPELGTDIIDLEKRIAELEEENQKIIIKQEEIKRELLKEEKKRSDYKKKLDDYRNYKKQTDEIKSEIIKIEEELQGLNSVDPVLDSDIEKTQESIAQNKSKIKDFENEISLMREGKCHTCGQDFHGDPDLLESEKNSCKEDLKNLSEILNQMKLQKQSYEFYYRKKNLLEAQLDETKKKQDSINKIPVVKRKKFNMDELEKKLEECSFDKEDELKNSQREFYRLEQKEIHRKQVINHNEKIKKEKKKNDELIEKLNSDLDGYEYRKKILEDSKKILGKDFSSYVIDKATRFIETEMNSFFQKCYGKYNVYFRQNDKRNGIEFYYSESDNNETIVPASMASGFESQLLALSFRVSLGNLNGLRLFAFDEADSDASSQNSVNLYNVLLESDEYDQVFIITHKYNTVEFIQNNFNGVKVIEL